jgi:NAD(P)-dependent dehydrogenase (short-subunit alcohol dehydrogenase family)
LSYKYVLHEKKMNGRVSGKTALITGAGTGVGRACMELFVAQGAKVFGVGRTMATLQESLAAATAHGGEGAVHVANLSEEEAVAAAVDAAIDRFGRIDMLIHAAGVGYSWAEKSPGSMNDVASTSPDKWREVIGINLDGYYLVSRAVLPHMIAAGGGSIVAVTSISGFLGLPAAHAYCASKAGMINLTRSMCVAYAKDNVRANCIAPGFIDTPMVASVIDIFADPAVAEQAAPMRRPGTPMEMAQGCLYLASDEASYCNGTVLVIDGGSSARQ